MHDAILSVIVCPDCRADREFVLTVFDNNRDDIIEGVLRCDACGQWYRIADSIVDLLPSSLRRTDKCALFAAKHDLSSDSAGASGMIAKEKQIEFFASDASSYEQDVTNSPYFKAFDDCVFLPWMMRSVEAGARVVEVGVGTGRQSVRMAKAGAHVVGVDISEEMLLVARSVIRDADVLAGCDFLVADAEALPFRSSSFDAAVSVGTLHHVPTPSCVVGEMGRVMKDGAAVFTYDPHRSPVRFLFDAMMRWWRLYEEEASDDPLLTVEDMMLWMKSAKVSGSARVATYVPPHLCYMLGHAVNCRVLRVTDRIFGALPVLKRCGGMVVFEGHRD